MFFTEMTRYSHFTLGNITASPAPVNKTLLRWLHTKPQPTTLRRWHCRYPGKLRTSGSFSKKERRLNWACLLSQGFSTAESLWKTRSPRLKAWMAPRQVAPRSDCQHCTLQMQFLKTYALQRTQHLKAACLRASTMLQVPLELSRVSFED